MQALRFRSPGGLEALALSVLDDPGEPGPGAIRVRIKATSLNGHDFNVAMARLPVSDGRTLMSDGAGIVEAVGSGVTAFKPGDRVVSLFFPDWLDGDAPRANFSRTPGDGLEGFGTNVVVRDADHFTPAPREWSFVESATLTTAGLTAWRALNVESTIDSSSTVLLLGTGGVSLLALQFALQRGSRVIVTSSSDDKIQRVLARGATFGVNYRRHTDWSAEVQRLTEGRGADVILETGGPGTLAQSIQACRIGGSIILVGVLTGIQGTVPTAALMSRQIRLQGITVGSRTHQLAMIADVAKSPARPMIDRVFPFENIVDAFKMQASAAHIGKLCVQLE